MIILGLSIGEISSAALVKDGILLGAANEERFYRRKNYSGFPLKTVKYLLSSNKLKYEDIDQVSVINTKTSGLEFSLIQRLNSFTVNDFIIEAKEIYYKNIYQNKKIRPLLYFKKKIQKNIYPNNVYKELLKNGETKKNTQRLRTEIIKSALKRKDLKIEFIDHHLGHALYGLLYAPKNAENSIIFTADSMGDEKNSNVYYASEDKIKRIFSSSKQNLGRLFRNITLLMGMKPYQHEYKLMGMAPYADKNHYSQVKNILKNYMYGFKGDWLFKKKPKDHYFLFKKKFEGIRFDNIAGGLQSYFEDRLIDWFDYFLKRDDKCKTVIFSGGLSMNVKANLKLENLCKKYNKTFFSAPSGDDYSQSISAAYASLLKKNFWNKQKIIKGTLDNLYQGYNFNELDQKKVINWANNNNWKKKSNKLISKELQNGKIFALCHGKAEFGSRALGNRSIIADPSKFENIKKINTVIKMRDFWMPFAPAVLKGYETKYFKTNNWKNHRFMASSAETTIEGKFKLKAAAHPYDGTIRPMVVTKDKNKIFYNIIKNFGKLTNTYSLLNTSLNLHGFPIVNNANDLIFLLKKTKIDGFILENDFFIRPKKNYKIKKLKKKNNIDIKIKSKRILIEKMKRQHITKGYVERLNDKQLMKYSRHHNKKHTIKSSLEYFSKLDLSDNLYLSIKDRKTKKLIGTITAYLKKNFLTADIGILISSKQHLGKGYATEAWINLMSFLNKKMKVKNITGGCLLNHIKMIKIFKNSGMSYFHKDNKKIVYIKKF